MVKCAGITVSTPGRVMVDITGRVDEIVRGSGVSDGICHVFVHHTSASLTINEKADPDVIRDLETYFERLVPDGHEMYRHRSEGPDDMSSHIRCALTESSVVVPVRNGALSLGTWQGVFLWEHRETPHQRRISVTVLG